MIHEFGDMWTAWDRADLFLITTNSYLKSPGVLVMGRGVARQARDRFPGLDKTLGMHIDHLGCYGLLISPLWPERKLGLFQVKGHFSHPADLDLITKSTRELVDWCLAHPSAEVHLNFPGIGNGQLKAEEVMPVITALPDSVHVWRYKRV